MYHLTQLCELLTLASQAIEGVYVFHQPHTLLHVVLVLCYAHVLCNSQSLSIIIHCGHRWQAISWRTIICTYILESFKGTCFTREPTTPTNTFLTSQFSCTWTQPHTHAVVVYTVCSIQHVVHMHSIVYMQCLVSVDMVDVEG